MLASFLFATILATSIAASARAATCADGDNQMSVEGVEGVFCVTGDPCLATFSTGACPLVQEGLPYGSYCGIVASGVYGCKTFTSPQTPAPTPTPAETPAPVVLVPTVTPSTGCTMESIRVSVQGLKGSYCVNEPVCVQQISTGNCPDPQDGLPFGSYCDLLQTGAYGCKPYIATDVPANVTYEAPKDCSNNRAGDTPVSIVGAKADFCASQPICSGTIFGNCPKVQDGLPQDSECMTIDTNVYGCVFMASTT